MPRFREVFDNKGEERDWIGIALAIMFVLIGLGVVIAALRYNGGAIDVNGAIQGFWSIFGTLIGVAFVIWICCWIFGWTTPWWHTGHYGRRYGYRGEPADIVKERYARGEINKREYDEMMKDLKG